MPLGQVQVPFRQWTKDEAIGEFMACGTTDEATLSSRLVGVADLQL